MELSPEAEEPAPIGDSVRDTVTSLAEFHEEHYRNASRLQRTMDAFTDRLGRPGMVLLVLAAMVGWSLTAAARTGGRVDQPLFGWLELTATLLSLAVALLILVTQRREDELAQRREKLTLELALLADRKSSKIISLLEEMRRDHPGLRDRVDDETADLAVAADPSAVLAALDDRSEVDAK